MRHSTLKAFAALATVVLGFGMVSCSGEDEPVLKSDIKDAHITFTYTVPDTLFHYVDITVAYNNNKGDDAVWYPMLENTYTVNYDLDHFPVTAPVIIIFDKSNRLVSGINVDWPLDMDVTVDAVIDGKQVTKEFHSTYELKGDLAAAITNLQNNSPLCTYAIGIGADGDIIFRH